MTGPGCLGQLGRLLQVRPGHERTRQRGAARGRRRFEAAEAGAGAGRSGQEAFVAVSLSELHQTGLGRGPLFFCVQGL